MIALENVSYHYPFQPQPAVADISLSVGAGEVVLITGESGCGKSTLAKIVNGLAPHYFKGDLSGTANVCGVDNSTAEIADISNRIGTLFQCPEQQFFCNNVYNELSFAHEVRQKSVTEIQQVVEKYSAIFEIENILESSVFSLSEGEKQKVALASILSLSPQCLILDEPTANLSPEATEQLRRQVEILKQQGFAVLIVDHRLYWLEGVADRVLVMKDGRIQQQGNFDILMDDGLREQFGLRKNTVCRQKKKPEEHTDGLVIKDLGFAYKKKPAIFKNFNLTIPAGKITALCGPNGVGKTTLSRLITGLLTPGSGTLCFKGKNYQPKKLLSLSSLVLQNMDHQLHARSVLDEVSGQVDILKELQLETMADRHPQSLSGGEKQRLVIAAAIAKNSEIIILDEPTSGLDGKNMRIIGRILRKEAEKNKVIMVITHDLEFIHECCDIQLTVNPNNEE